MISFSITTVRDAASAALASGTHRLKLSPNQSGRLEAELVERENPDPDVLYMKRGEKKGPFVVCPTPFTSSGGHEIEIVLIKDPASSVGFNIMVNMPSEAGKPAYIVFDQRK